MSKEVVVHWYRTEEYSATFKMPDDFDLNADDADEDLLDQIGNLEGQELIDAYDACTELEITYKEVTS
ncbi:hypothetical protein SEA_RIZWANA_86 [Arthrobacter phage Rizwana]|nr:hypothetical protein SEA_RIZWANA_86 [Arthrobacter phage Rizwana]